MQGPRGRDGWGGKEGRFVELYILNSRLCLLSPRAARKVKYASPKQCGAGLGAIRYGLPEAPDSTSHHRDPEITAWFDMD